MSTAHLSQNKFIVLIALFCAALFLGLPANGLGIAWPYIRAEFNAPLPYAGLIAALASGCSALACIFTGFLLSRFSYVKILNLALGGYLLGLLGYALSPTLLYFTLATIPFGIASGLSTTLCSSYISLNYSCRQMNWFHGFWGLGASAGSAMMTFALTYTAYWQGGYFGFIAIQFLFFLFIFSSRKLWKSPKFVTTDCAPQKKLALNIDQTTACFIFFILGPIENGIAVWLYSTLVEGYRFNTEFCGLLIVSYWIAFTGGRFIIGFVAPYVGNLNILRSCAIGTILATGIMTTGNIYLLSFAIPFAGFCISGIFPALMQETPKRFGATLSKSMVGYQNASGSLGGMIMVPLMGIFMSATTLHSFSWILLGLSIMLTLLVQLVYFKKRGKK